MRERRKVLTTPGLRERCGRGPPAVRMLLVPEGHRRKLAGGKSASADAAPGGCANRPCPNGASEKVPVLSAVRHLAAGWPPPQTRPILTRARTPSPSRRVLVHFFDAPLGHGATPQGYRGLRPLPRACPRLISCGVPPGREAPSFIEGKGAGDSGVSFPTFRRLKPGLQTNGGPMLRRCGAPVLLTAAATAAVWSSAFRRQTVRTRTP